MLLILLIPILALVALVHRYIQLYAPSNLLIRRVRIAAPRFRIAVVLLALAAALLFAMHAMAEAVAAGAPGWLNLVVLLLGWDAVKIGALASAAIIGRLRGVALPAPETGQSASTHPTRLAHYPDTGSRITTTEDVW
jgi:hypothetical protein